MEPRERPADELHMNFVGLAGQTFNGMQRKLLTTS
jgi:hypothetical protein